MAAALLGIAGCAMPPPPPPRRAVIPVDPAATAQPGRYFAATSEAATPRARAYVDGKLPAPAGLFLESLVVEGFTCRDGACRFAAYHAARPCGAMIIVGIDVVLRDPSMPRDAILTAADVTVEAGASPNPQAIELRGCLFR
jgi:hypothetical protein